MARINKVVIANQDRYDSPSHFVRCAINRLLAKEEGQRREL